MYFTLYHKKLKSDSCYTGESQILEHFAVLMFLSVDDGR